MTWTVLIILNIVGVEAFWETARYHKMPVYVIVFAFNGFVNGLWLFLKTMQVIHWMSDAAYRDNIKWVSPFILVGFTMIIMEFTRTAKQMRKMGVTGFDTLGAKRLQSSQDDSTTSATTTESD